MNDFKKEALRYSRSPLGIIALSFVTVYGIAGLAATSSTFTLFERYILVVFLVVFPVLVLATFYKLVTNHHDKLYSPSDFSNDENFLRFVKSSIETTVDDSMKQVKEDLNESIKRLVEKERAHSSQLEKLERQIVQAPENDMKRLQEEINVHKLQVEELQEQIIKLEAKKSGEQ